MKIADTFIRLKQVVMTSSGTCLFLGNDQKTFIIYVDPVMGEQIRFASSKQAPSRPLTFDFMRYLLFGLDVSVRHIVLYRAEKETFFAKIICQQLCGSVTHAEDFRFKKYSQCLFVAEFETSVFCVYSLPAKDLRFSRTQKAKTTKKLSLRKSSNLTQIS